jgi:PAS domain S-box-containing protein
MQPSENGYQQLLDQYRFIMNTTPGMIWTARPDGQLDYVNEWMVRYTGLAAEQLLGEGWLEVVHPQDREMAEQVWRNALKEEVSNRLELRLRRADGTYHWHLRSVIPYRDQTGNVLKWVGINTDIHDQKLKEAALKDNQLLLETGKGFLRKPARKQYGWYPGSGPFRPHPGLEPYHGKPDRSAQG